MLFDLWILQVLFDLWIMQVYGQGIQQFESEDGSECFELTTNDLLSLLTHQSLMQNNHNCESMQEHYELYVCGFWETTY